MKPKTSSGPALLSAKILKTIKHEISPILAYLINLSLEQGIFPDDLKLAKVIPIYKAEDKHIYGNYRPISLLPTLSKIYEKVVSYQIVTYLQDNNLLYTNQYGFRSGHSTIHPLIKFLDFISNAHTYNEYAIAIFIDLKKAFDTVNHEILLEKFKSMRNGRPIALHQTLSREISVKCRLECPRPPLTLAKVTFLFS